MVVVVAAACRRWPLGGADVVVAAAVAAVARRVGSGNWERGAIMTMLLFLAMRRGLIWMPAVSDGSRRRGGEVARPVGEAARPVGGEAARWRWQLPVTSGGSGSGSGPWRRSLVSCR